MKNVLFVVLLSVVVAVCSVLFTLHHVQIVNVADDSIILSVYGQSWEYGYKQAD